VEDNITGEVVIHPIGFFYFSFKISEVML